MAHVPSFHDKVVETSVTAQPTTWFLIPGELDYYVLYIMRCKNSLDALSSFSRRGSAILVAPFVDVFMYVYMYVLHRNPS
jgi:hypothetical protein